MIKLPAISACLRVITIPVQLVSEPCVCVLHKCMLVGVFADIETGYACVFTMSCVCQCTLSKNL